MILSPRIWGPHYWFFLHTCAMAYPIKPNTVIKKKFYEFIQNFSLFIPDKKISVSFSRLIDKYPVSPYLDSRDSFIRWTHFIHNKVNRKLEKPQKSISNFYAEYYKSYEPINIQNIKWKKMKKHIVYAFVLIIFIIITYCFYKY